MKLNSSYAKKNMVIIQFKDDNLQKVTPITILYIWLNENEKIIMFLRLFFLATLKNQTPERKENEQFEWKFKWQRTQVENPHTAHRVPCRLFLRKRLLPFGFHRHFDIVSLLQLLFFAIHFLQVYDSQPDTRSHLEILWKRFTREFPTTHNK